MNPSIDEVGGVDQEARPRSRRRRRRSSRAGARPRSGRRARGRASRRAASRRRARRPGRAPPRRGAATALSASKIILAARSSPTAGAGRDQDEHRLERGEVDERLHLDVLVDVGVGLADARDRADRDVAREERRQLAAGLRAGGDDRVAGVDLLVLADLVEDQRRAARCRGRASRPRPGSSRRPRGRRSRGR